MTDLIWVAAFFAISFHNPQALIVFVGYMLAEVAFVTIDDAIYYNCVVGLICAMSGAVDLYVLLLLIGGRRLECFLSSSAEYWILACRYRILCLSDSAVKQIRERTR